MEAQETPYRRYILGVIWSAVLLSLYLLYSRMILPNAAGITLTGDKVLASLKEIGGFLFGIGVGLALIEVFVYQLFFRRPKGTVALVLTRGVQIIMGVLVVLLLISFFELTDLIRLGDGPVGQIVRFPATAFVSFSQALADTGLVAAKSASSLGIGIVAVLLAVILVLFQVFSEPRNSRLGLAYLLVTPAFLGVMFLIVYPFMFEIKLAFSNASLGTKATKEALYGLQYGLDNLKTLFTGNVAKDAKFVDVFLRTILWTVINVTCHVAGGMGLALLLHRPMKLQGFYRTLLVFPWAVPTTIAAMALRNEFDQRYGLFNILLTDLRDFFQRTAEATASLLVVGDSFSWLAAHIGPVAWKQDPFWAFVSILISNIWLGIPFMSVIILGGLQSISSEYYEAAEIDGANKFQQFRNITLPLLRPVLTPAVILGVVWTFNKFDVIYLITQGGPQEKTDILVSSMYKAAFQFYRYGFTAMFALVIFIILLIFTLIYLKVGGGLKSATE